MSIRASYLLGGPVRSRRPGSPPTSVSARRVMRLITSHCRTPGVGGPGMGQARRP